MSFTIIKKLSLSGRATGQNIIHLRQEQMHQNLSFMLLICSLSVWSRSARRTSRRLYRNGYPQPFQTCARIQCPSPNGLGCFLVCLQSNTLWIQVMTQQNLQLRTLPTSNAKSMRLDFLMTGIVKSIQQIQTTTSGPNGFSLSFTKRLGL